MPAMITPKSEIESIKKTLVAIEKLTVSNNKDIQEIKNLLLGNGEYSDGVGMVDMARTSYRWVEKYGCHLEEVSLYWGAVKILASLMGLSSVATVVLLIDFIKDKI